MGRNRLHRNTVMINGIFTGVNNLQRAMTKTSERQGLLMRNLANVNVPGYKRQDMDFHVVLDEEMNVFSPQDQAQTANSSNLRRDGNNVDLETEVLSISDMELRFGALTEITSRTFSGLKSVIREGK